MIEIGELLRLRRDRLFAEIVFQQASMPDEGGVVGRSGDIKAHINLQKAE